MKTCYIIHKTDKVEAVEGVRRAKQRNKIYGGLLVTNINDLLQHNTATIQSVYNGMIAVHGPEGYNPVKCFHNKTKAAKRLFTLLETIFNPKNKKDTRTGRGVYLPHKNFLKPPRPGTKIEAVLCAIAQPEGATFEALHQMIGGRRRNVNIFLQDINRRCGYGITTERKDGVNVYKLMGMQPDRSE